MKNTWDHFPAQPGYAEYWRLLSWDCRTLYMVVNRKYRGEGWEVFDFAHDGSTPRYTISLPAGLSPEETVARIEVEIALRAGD